MYKKSLNKEKFNERQFVLDKYQLFYYKKDKASKSNQFLNLFLEDQNFNLIMLNNASIQVVDQGTYKGQKYCIEIENENRKYVLATKS
jgi:hypothetical protein